MRSYADSTVVSTERSESEIKRTLLRYGADDVSSGTSSRMGQAFVSFVYAELPFCMTITIPKKDEERFHVTPERRNKRSEAQALKEWEKECRRKWRVLLLLIKAGLEAVEEGVAKPEQAFMSWLVLPNGTTVGDHVLPQVTKALESGSQLALPAWPGGNGR